MLSATGRMVYMDPNYPAVPHCQSVIDICTGMIEGVAVILFGWLLIRVLLSKYQQEHLQVFLGVGLALLCFSFLLSCAICWRRSRWCKHNRSKNRVLEQTLVDLRPALPSKTTAVAIQQQYTRTVGEAANDSPGSPGCGSPPNRTVLSRASLSSYPFSQTLKLPSMLLEGWEHRRNTSSNSIFYNEHRPLTSPVQGASLHQSYTVPENLSSTSSKPQPQLHFTLLYSQSEATLTVTVIGVSHLPKVSRSSRSSYVKVYLLPRFIEPQRTAVRRKSLNPEFQEQFQFGRYSLEELRRFTLRFAVYMKARSLKDLFIGEVMFPCAQVTWNPKVSSSYSWELSTTKTKLRKCISSQDVSSSISSPQPRSLGQLFLLLQYQALANRIKVLIRKAENLSRLTRMPGTPDHYIVIHLYHDGKIIDTKETKGIAGYNPVWNTPFLFSIPAGDIQQQQLSLEFIVMQARIYTRSCTLGRVLIGPNAPEAGLIHWKEMCSRGQVESARWHLIQPDVSRLSP